MNIVGPQTGGDPMGKTKFVRRSLQDPQHGTGHAGVLGLPHDRGPAPADPGLLAQDQRQAVHGADHFDRDRQFVNIQEWIDIFEEAG